MALLIKDLRGMFDCAGFVAKQGRYPRIEDAGFLPGPIDIRVNSFDGLVVEVGACLTADNDDHIVDGADLVATPGFFDSHTHPIFAGSRALEFFQRWNGVSYLEINRSGGGIGKTVRETAQASDEQLLSLLMERLREMRKCGVVVVEAKSGYGTNAQDELRLLRILAKVRSNFSQDIPKLRTTFLGLHTLPPGADEVAFVDAMIGILPEIAEGNLADYVDAFPEFGFFSLEQSVRFIREALHYGLKPKVHADELTDMRAAETFCKLGALSVDHLQRLSAEAIPLLAEVETVATLLPATSLYLGFPYANARALIDQGICVALASDYNPGTAPCLGIGITQLLAASQLKMSAAEILCASTVNGALAMGLDPVSASIQVGTPATSIIFWKVSEAFHDDDPECFLAEVFSSMKKPTAIDMPLMRMTLT